MSIYSDKKTLALCGFCEVLLGNYDSGFRPKRPDLQCRLRNPVFFVSGGLGEGSGAAGASLSCHKVKRWCCQGLSSDACLQRWLSAKRQPEGSQSSWPLSRGLSSHLSASPFPKRPCLSQLPGLEPPLCSKLCCCRPTV